MNGVINRAPRMGTRRQLILNAASRAGRVRNQAGLTLTCSASPFEIADRLGVEVRFTNDMPSMEGLYVKHPRPRILISTLRPAGRQSFSAAHELGHHVFGHEGHVLRNSGDEDESETVRQFDPNEVLADAFAAHLLMPKTAVQSAVRLRDINLQSCRAEDMYRIAWFFGVGYDTLVRHMCHTLEFIGPQKADELRKSTPKKIRRDLLGVDIKEDVVPIDRFWDGTRAADVQVGDVILLPPGFKVAPDEMAVEIIEVTAERTLGRARVAGVARVIDPTSDWAVFIRVARREYAGLARYRYLPDDPEEEEETYDGLQTG